MSEPLQLQDVVFTSGIVYYILDSSIELFSSETSYGWKTFAEIGKKYHYLKDERINLFTAVQLWQYINGRHLTKEEYQKVIDDNIPRLGA